MRGSAVSPRADPVPLCRHEGARVRVRAAAPLPPSAGEVPSAPAPEVPGQVPGHTGAHLWHLLGAVPLCGRGMLAPGFPVLPSVPQEGNDKVSAPQLPVPLCWEMAVGAHRAGSCVVKRQLNKNIQSEAMARLKPCS